MRDMLRAQRPPPRAGAPVRRHDADRAQPAHRRHLDRHSEPGLHRGRHRRLRPRPCACASEGSGRRAWARADAYLHGHPGTRTRDHVHRAWLSHVPHPRSGARLTRTHPLHPRRRVARSTHDRCSRRTERHPNSLGCRRPLHGTSPATAGTAVQGWRHAQRLHTERQLERRPRSRPVRGACQELRRGAGRRRSSVAAV